MPVHVGHLSIELIEDKSCLLIYVLVHLVLMLSSVKLFFLVVDRDAWFEHFLKRKFFLQIKCSCRNIDHLTNEGIDVFTVKKRIWKWRCLQMWLLESKLRCKVNMMELSRRRQARASDCSWTGNLVGWDCVWRRLKQNHAVNQTLPYLNCPFTKEFRRFLTEGFPSWMKETGTTGPIRARAEGPCMFWNQQEERVKSMRTLWVTKVNVCVHGLLVWSSGS